MMRNTGKRDFLTLSDFSRQEILALLDRTAEMKRADEAQILKTLASATVALMFEKPSTRTRVSFEVAIRQLGGHPLFLNWRDIQLNRGEPLRDTGRVLSRYVQALVVRTYSHTTVQELAQWSTVPVINALTDRFHPCQVLADLFTLREAGLDIETMTAAWIGDGNNMANSWIVAAEVLGFSLKLACPEGYEPLEAAGSKRASVVRSPQEAVAGAHVISTDVWASMGNEAEVDRRRAVFKPYQVNGDLLSTAEAGARVLHCLPAHRGEEITDEVMESPVSLIWEEAENRLHVQKALLERLFNQRCSDGQLA